MEYLSFSRLSLLETCGLRFYYEYVLALPPEDPVPTYHASFGTLLHSLYEAHANSAGARVYEDLKQEFDSLFPQMVAEFPSREDAIAFYRKGIQAIARFSRYRVDRVIASEMEFLLPVAPGVPPVKGYVDRVLHTEGHGYMVADLKTGKPFSGRNPKKMRQLVLYSIACQQSFGEPAASGYFDFVVQGSKEWVDITDSDRDAVRAWVSARWAQIEREDFPPRYSQGFCSVYCPYRSRCPAYAAHAGERESAAAQP